MVAGEIGGDECSSAGRNPGFGPNYFLFPQLTGICCKWLVELTILVKFNRSERRVGKFPDYFPGSREFAR